MKNFHQSDSVCDNKSLTESAKSIPFFTQKVVSGEIFKRILVDNFSYYTKEAAGSDIINIFENSDHC